MYLSVVTVTFGIGLHVNGISLDNSPAKKNTYVYNFLIISV